MEIIFRLVSLPESGEQAASQQEILSLLYHTPIFRVIIQT